MRKKVEVKKLEAIDLY
jgi:hypothetical protein